MQVELKRVDKDFHLRAVGSAGVAVDIDGAEAIGGHNAGARPMELFLMGLGACTSIDVISILRKQKFEIEDLSISIEGDREKEKVPSLFTDIRVHFTFKGKLDESKVKRAIELSMDKYCSATATLRKTANITYTFSIEQTDQTETH